MHRVILVSAVALMTALPVVAEQPRIKAEDVVDFMVESANLGLSRGICIGTSEECAPPEPDGMDMLINFELDSADLTAEARENLAVFANALQDDRLQNASFVVEGHTDARGIDGYNDQLSKARAASVQQYLVDLGVSAARLDAIGLGETQPRTDNAMDPENRRVELRIAVQ
ncbi:OmpA family protein [Actibacterium sp. 188UL27-1]|uniref:OmpA family protein n=1 Tax=Actibacterium sp. 188UL27-1 TaxID=2786961 RepID=UPI00195CF96B|nr:OmpA family protein [Actibacterium sp. 188UL27-1]MBM7068831.1 OmpA family protein [Actibacterium sp. 188UL27-1]